MTEEQKKKWEEELSWLPPEKRAKIIAERGAGYVKSGTKWTEAERAEFTSALDVLIGNLSRQLKRSPNAIYWELEKWAKARKEG